MRTGTPFTLCGAMLLCLAAAGGAEWQLREYQGRADWELARATAHAESYVQSFDGPQLEAQLSAFKERRGLLQRAEGWERARALAVLAAALLSVLTYAAWFLARLEACRVEEALRPPSDVETAPGGAGLAPARG